MIRVGGIAVWRRRLRRERNALQCIAGYMVVENSSLLSRAIDKHTVLAITKRDIAAPTSRQFSLSLRSKRFGGSILEIRDSLVSPTNTPVLPKGSLVCELAYLFSEQLGGKMSEQEGEELRITIELPMSVQEEESASAEIHH